MATRIEATIDDLRRVEGKAELVNGEIVHMSPTGGLHGYAARAIVHSLLMFQDATKCDGCVFADNVGFIVNLPRRKSFSPDAAYYVGQVTDDFLQGAPVFAVEIRSKRDIGPAADRRIAEKRADYFAAGTLVVWDVDLHGEVVVRSYSADAPDHPQEFRRGEMANAAAALPGWEMPVDAMFPRA
jgi:Uma2 family endonuclease